MASELWCWRRLLRIRWTARRSYQCILKEMSPEYSLEGLMLKLKFQYFGHLMWRTNSLEKTLMLGEIEGRRRRGQQKEMVGWHHQLVHEFEQAPGVGDGQGSLACCSPWGNKELDMTDDWTDWLNPLSITLFANVFSWSVFVFPLFIFILFIYFAVQKLLNLIICPIQTSGLWTSRPVHREP